MRLIPRDDKYFTLMNELACKVKEGGAIFAKIFSDFQNHAQYAEEIKALENCCDDLSANIGKKLNSSFITPIDREDIYLLTTELDDVIDMINDLARRLTIYEMESLRPDAEEITGLLARATAEIEGAFTALERRENLDDHCKIIKQLEKRADSLYSEAIRRLFKEEKNSIEIIKWMDLYERLEDSIDRCKDVAEALESVVVKNQ